MIPRIDINSDIGESFGAYKIGKDEHVVPYISSANIACGFHASDPVVMDRTVKLCKEYGVMVGAHPGYPDLLGFGRRFMELSEEELVCYVIYQVGALKGFLDLHGLRLQHVKLHGALYNYVADREDLILKIAEPVKKAFGEVYFFILGTKKGREVKKMLAPMGIRLALEAFPDRMYTEEGGLMPRRFKEAVIHDPDLIAERAVRMVKEGGIESVNGMWIEMDIDTLCIHGDNEESILAARKIKEAMEREGIEIRPIGS